MGDNVNQRFGWLLLLAGWIWAVVLDPWSLSEQDPALVVGSPRSAARHAQAVIIAMGFLQLAISRLTPRYPDRPSRLNDSLSLTGTLLYCFGYILLACGSHHLGAIPAGAALNLLAFLLLSPQAWSSGGSLEHRIVLTTFCLGMMLDILMGLFAVDPEHFLPPGIGPEDGVHQRMLRLARVAAVALSLLLLLYQELLDQLQPKSRLVAFGKIGMLVGCLGMPLVLMLASLIDLRIKYLLAIPALCTTAAAIVGLLLTYKQQRRLEPWGWGLIVISMNLGLLIGLYAFDGPLPAPPLQEEYNGFHRRLLRLAHADCIVFGLLAIVAARAGCSRRSARLLMIGSFVTLFAIGILAFWPKIPVLLGIGPFLVALAIGSVAWESQGWNLQRGNP